jgi:hypothetical protein
VLGYARSAGSCVSTSNNNRRKGTCATHICGYSPLQRLLLVSSGGAGRTRCESALDVSQRSRHRTAAKQLQRLCLSTAELQRCLRRKTHRLPRQASGLAGCALFYGDGVITPAVTVLGALEGLAVAAPSLARVSVSHRRGLWKWAVKLRFKLVGERGAEIFTPSRSASIIPNGRRNILIQNYGPPGQVQVRTQTSSSVPTTRK